MVTLRYGSTNTFFIPGREGGLLADTGYAGTLPVFFKALKQGGIALKDVKYVMATHFHPDHAGLIGELTELGVKLLLVDVQQDFIHFPDKIFERDKLAYKPADETQAAVVSCAQSREFLQRMGIDGQIVHTPSHSADSVSLVLDSGDCFVGDLEPMEYIGAYEDAQALKSDWDKILALKPKRIFYAHRPACATV